MNPSTILRQLETTGQTDGFELYHGGTMGGAKTPKKGRWEYGPGLYLTTSYDLARKYAGGSRRVYRCRIARGTEIGQVRIPIPAVETFLRLYGGTKRKAMLSDLLRYARDGTYPASVLLNLCVNYELRPSSTVHLKALLVEHGASYAVNRWSGGSGANTYVMVLFDDSLLLRFTPVGDPGDTERGFPPPL